MRSTALSLVLATGAVTARPAAEGFGAAAARAAESAVRVASRRAAAAAAGAPFPTCTVSPTLGCYSDAGARVVGYLVDQTDAAMTVESCGLACAASGFTFVGTTAHPGSGYCYCDVAANPAAQPAAAASCNVPCPGNASETCGGSGYTSLYKLTCDGPLPPAPVGPPLAPGRACSQPQTAGWLWCNASAPLEDRLADLVGRFSLPEIGPQLTSLAGSDCRPSGVCPTSWPDGVATAASWNASAWQLMGAVTGRELRALDNVVWSKQAAPAGGLTAWGPTINLLRDTRWGRSQESASEDPYIAGSFGAAVSSGLQDGDDPRYLLAVATLKHFAAYSLEDYMNHEWRRQTFNAVVGPFDLADSYLPVFQRAITVGGAAGVLYAANELNGVPCAASTFLDAQLHNWGFDGYRCTDGGQIINMVCSPSNTTHCYVHSLDQAIGVAAAAESDIADGTEYQSGLTHAVVNGNTTLAAARTLLANIMRIRFRLGHFDPPAGQVYLNYTEADINDATARAGADLASRQALVLLKNTPGVLPLQSAAPGAPRHGLGTPATNLAVIGPNCNSTLVLQGNYGGQYCLPGPHGPRTDCYPNIYVSLRDAYAPASTYVQGSAIASSIPGGVDAAVAAVAAPGVDAVVMCLGLDQTQEAEQLDRVNMTLPAAQGELYAAVAGAAAARGLPVIVVLVHGGALVIPEIKANASAIIDAFYPGVTAGPAIADALFGAYNPGGRLPYTVPGPEYQAAFNFTDMSIATVATAPNGGGRTYRYYKGTPTWPFGFGLSYTSFKLAWAPGAAPPPVVTLSVSTSPPSVLVVQVTNTGAMAGDDVVQLYYTPVAGSLGPREPPALPSLALFGFARQAVPVRGSANVPLVLDPAELAVTGTDNVRRPTPGNYTITVTDGGADPAAQRLTFTVVLTP